MADFLTRLAQRALGTAPLVKPVIAPLFGQGPSLAISRAEEAGGAAGHDGGAVSSRPARPRPVGPVGDTIPRPTQDARAPALGGRSSQSEVSVPSAIAPAGDSDPAVARHGRTTFESLVGAQGRQEESKRPESLTEDSVPSQSVERLTRRLASPHLAVEARPLPSVQPPTGRPTLTPAYRRDAGTPGRAQVWPVQPPQSSPPAPMVRVTIGRVDVRAVFAAPQTSPPTQPARPHQALSLEQYLQQRNGGRR